MQQIPIRTPFQVACTSVAVVFVLYRTLLLLVFLPFAGSIWSFVGAYLSLTIGFGIVTIALSLTNRSVPANAFAIFLPVMAIAFWWFYICKGATPIWSDFRAFVVPEICFAVVILARGVAPRKHLDV
jgi:hypothetical protein